MEVVLLGARMVLAAVFLTAALGKLRDLAGARQALTDFGVPPGMARVAGPLLPTAELALAVGLLVPGTAWWAAVAAAGLLLVFCAGIGRALVRGERPDCQCFGRAHSRPIGLGTLARNAVLFAFAIFIAVAGWDDAGASLTGWADGLTAGEIAAVTALAVLALLTALHVSFSYQLLKQNGRLAARVEALEVGANRSAGIGVGDAAPPFWLRTLDDRLVALEDLVADGPVLLLFSDARCESCDAVLAAIGRAGSDTGRRRVVVVAGGSMEDNRVKARRYGLGTMLVQEEHEVASAYGVGRVPAAVPIGADGRIAGATVSGPDAVRGLLPEAEVALIEPQLVAAGGGTQ
jgi:peroxiredoxin